MANAERAKLISDIQQHLFANGPGDWGVVQAKHPDVPASTFWRTVKQIRDNAAAPAIIEAARVELAARAAATTQDDKVDAIAANLPVAPPPAYLAKAGDQGRTQLDLLGKIERLFADADLLREFSMSAEGKLKNPMFFSTSISLHIKLVDAAVRAAEAIWNLQRQMDFYDAIIEEIAKVSPEAAQAILERLHALNERTGMRFDGRP